MSSCGYIEKIGVLLPEPIPEFLGCVLIASADVIGRNALFELVLVLRVHLHQLLIEGFFGDLVVFIYFVNAFVVFL